MQSENTQERDDAGSPPASWWQKLGANDVEHAHLDGRVSAVELWGQKQNGALARIEKGQEELRDGFNAFKLSSSRWLVSALTTLLIALILLVVNLLVEPNKMENAAMAAVQKSIPDVVNQAVDAALSRAAADK